MLGGGGSASGHLSVKYGEYRLRIFILREVFFYVYVSCDCLSRRLLAAQPQPARNIPQKCSAPDAQKRAKGHFLFAILKYTFKFSSGLKIHGYPLIVVVCDVSSLYNWTRVHTNSLRGSASCL